MQTSAKKSVSLSLPLVRFRFKIQYCQKFNRLHCLQYIKFPSVFFLDLRRKGSFFFTACVCCAVQIPSLFLLGKPRDQPPCTVPFSFFISFSARRPAGLDTPPMLHFSARRPAGLVTLAVLLCTDKKENQIFLIYKEIQNGAVAKSYITNGLLIYGEIFAHFLIY